MNHETPGTRSSPGAWIALAVCAAVLLGGVVFPGGTTWGIHALGRLGTGPAAAGMAIVVLAYVAGAAARNRAWSTGQRVPDGLLALVAAAAFALLAWNFRVATLLLGDGQLIVLDFELARQGSTDVVVSSVSSIVRNDFISPVTSLLHFAAVRIGAGAFATALAIESVLLGAAMAGALVLAIARWRTAGILAAWAFALTLLSPAILLYFGYVENYTAAHLALGLYVLLAIRSLGRPGRPLAPTVVLLLATGLHLQALVWWPSALFLWLARGQQPGAFAVRRLPLLVTVAALLAGLAITTAKPTGMLLGHGGELSLWSIRHGLDVLQGLWLVFPLLPFALWLRLRAGPASARLAFTDLLVGPAVVYLFLIDPVLGAARDWDRIAFVSWAFALQVCVLLELGLEGGRWSTRELRRWLAPAAAIAAVATLSWIALNHSEPRSLDRIEDLVRADPHAHEHGFEALTRYHADQEQWPEAARWAQEAYVSSGNPRLATLAAQHLLRASRPVEALAILETAIERQPGDHRARYELVKLVWETGDYARTLDIALEGTRRHPQESIYPFFAGDCLFRLDRLAESREQLARALALGDLPEGSRRHAQRLLGEIGAAGD